MPLGGTGADCPLPREPRSGFAESLCALDLSPELQDSWMLGFQAVWTLGFLGSLFGWENFNIQTKPEGLWPLCIDHILLRPELKVGFPTELFDLLVNPFHFGDKCVLKMAGGALVSYTCHFDKPKPAL